MTIARNWMQTLSPSSYRGTRFWVDKDEVKTGRRLVVHEFPHRDQPYVEDLGRTANEVSVTAYVASDEADKEEKALRKSCEKGGSASLRLPIGSFKAHCQSCSRSFEKDRLGFIAFSLAFVIEGGGAAPFSLPVSVRQVEWLAQQATAPLAEQFARHFRTLDEGADVSEQAARVVRDFAGHVRLALRPARLAEGLAPVIVRHLSALSAESDALVAAGARGDRLERTVAVAEASERVSLLPGRLADLLAHVRAASKREEAPATLARIAQYTAPPEEVRALAPSAARREDNARAVEQLVGGLAAAEWAAAVIVRPYTDRRQAIQARADVTETFDRIMGPMRGALDFEAFTALADVRGETVTALSQLVASLAGVLLLETPRSLPAVVISQRLYGTAARAGEIAARNGAAHPGFLPRELEALAPV